MVSLGLNFEMHKICTFVKDSVRLKVWTNGMLLALLSLVCPIKTFAKAGFAERMLTNSYFQTAIAPYFWSIAAIFFLIVILLFKKKSIYCKIALSYSLLLAICCSDYFLELLAVLGALFIMSVIFAIGMIFWIAHFFSHSLNSTYKDLFKVTLFILVFIVAIILYDQICALLKYCFPIINETFRWVDPDMM